MMNQRVEYPITGSKGDIYTVSIEVLLDGVIVDCTCKGASMSNFCKHLRKICENDVADLIANTQLAENLAMHETHGTGS